MGQVLGSRRRWLGGWSQAQCLRGRFCDDIAWMTGRRPGLYWQVTWKVVSPLLLLTIFVAYISLLASTPPSYKAWNPQYVGPLGREREPGDRLRPGLALSWCHPGPRGPLGGHSRPKDHVGCFCSETLDRGCPRG